MTPSTQSSTTEPRVLVIGTGEYVSGYVHGEASKSDKPIGVVSVSLFDLKRRGKVSSVTLCGTNGQKFPGIRKHFHEKIQDVYKDMNVEFESHPSDDVARDTEAYKKAIQSMTPHRDICMIFTPDHTHYQIALEAAKHGLHVLVAKPLVQKLEHHEELMQVAKEQNIMIAVEVHKRWDPIYSDAWAKIRNTKEFGDFSFYQSYMSQPVSQLTTFRNWVGHSDISYYLNAHHIDFHCWSVAEGEQSAGGDATHFWRPTMVTATGSAGYAKTLVKDVDYDSITLSVQWSKLDARTKECSQTGTALYTSSWIGQKNSDVHSQQRFFYQGTKSEVTVDQAHRGYTQVTAQGGYKSVNPLFMKYTPDAQGYFNGQNGYGYRSFECFIDCVRAMNQKSRTLQEITSTGELATIQSNSTILTSAILHAGRQSLDAGGKPMRIVYGGGEEDGDSSIVGSVASQMPRIVKM